MAEFKMPETPELDKMKAVREESQAIGEFLEWLQGKHIHLAISEEGYSRPAYYTYDSTEALLAEFFDIDLKKVETERRAILDALRQVNQ